MYVFRPQQATGHAPGCKTAGASKPQHHVGRQAAKNQRRTQPKLRRPQTQQRRRQHLLRHLASEGHVGPRCLAAEPTGNGATCAAYGGHNFLDVPVRREGHGKGTARARLVDRLLRRSSEELVTALERKYGEKWPKHVLQGDFHIVEGMRRMCEAFGLRPELEWQVLKAIVNRARAIHSSKAEACSEFPLQNQLEAKRWRTQSEEEIASTSDGDSVDDPLDGGSSEATTASESEQGQSVACEFCECIPDVVETSSGGSGSECESEGQAPWKASWQSRVLKALGLQPLWPGRHAAAQATSPQQPQQPINQEPCPEPANVFEARRRDDEEDDDEDEEHILSSKLVAAVRNAELNTACAQAGKGLQRHLTNLDGPSSGAVAVTTANAGTDDRAAKHRAASGRILFARQSEVIFFTLPLGVAVPTEDALGPFEYRRPLETKVFDGPSGHKARRTPSSEAKASHGCEDEVASSTRWDRSVSETSLDEEDHVPEDVEDWEDRCDDIAELMAQQRSCLLWSPLW